MDKQAYTSYSKDLVLTCPSVCANILSNLIWHVCSITVWVCDEDVMSMICWYLLIYTLFIHAYQYVLCSCTASYICECDVVWAFKLVPQKMSLWKGRNCVDIYSLVQAYQKTTKLWPSLFFSLHKLLVCTELNLPGPVFVGIIFGSRSGRSSGWRTRPREIPWYFHGAAVFVDGGSAQAATGGVDASWRRCRCGAGASGGASGVAGGASRRHSAPSRSV